MRFACFALLLLSVCCASESRAADEARWVHEDLLRAEQDRILCRAFIPAESTKHHGELRFLKRGDALCLQTLLVSTSLRRGLREIRKEELYHWPDTREGHADSMKYLAALDAAKNEVLSPAELRKTGTYDPHGRLLIEFILDQEVSLFALYKVDALQVADGWEIQEAVPIDVQTASRAYISGAMQIMAENGFGASCPDFADSLQPINPAVP